MFNSNRGILGSMTWWPCQNTTSNQIPGYACMRVTGIADPSTTDEEYVLEVDQPDGSDSLYVLNGPTPIQAQKNGVNGQGNCTIGVPNMGLYDSTDTPSLWDNWGPKSGSWKLTKDYTGFKIIGNPTSGRVLVMPAPGAGAWIGVLQGSLAYGSSATVKLYKWDGTSGFTDTGTTDACYPWMLNSGDSIPANTEVAGCLIDNKRVVFNAGCKNIYGS